MLCLLWQKTEAMKNHSLKIIIMIIYCTIDLKIKKKRTKIENWGEWPEIMFPHYIL